MKVIWFVLKAPFVLLASFFKRNMSGEEFEDYIVKLLKRNGFRDVKTTKRSHDFGIDILAKKRGKAYAFQCKYYSKPVGVSAIQQAYTGCEYYGYDIPVVVTNQTFTRQAIALSKANGVYLWDGDYILKLKRMGYIKRFFISKEKQAHPYDDLAMLLFNEGYASKQLLMDYFDYSEQKANYIIEELVFYDFISDCDEYGVCDLLCGSVEEIKACLEQI